MKNVKKIISLFLLVTLVSVSFVGCSSDDLTLLSAITKSPSITSMESKTDMTLSFSAKGLAAEDQQSFDSIAPMLNGSKIVITQKSKSNADKTIAKGQADISVDLGGMGLSSSVWVDTDTSGTTPKIKEIMKVPAVLATSFPEKFQGKTYMVMDEQQLLDQSSTGSIDTKSLLDFSNNFTPKAMEFLKEYATHFDPGFTMVTKKDSKVVDGQTLTVYNLKLDDASFKKLLNAAVVSFSKNDKALGFVKDYLLAVNDLTGVSGTEKEQGKQEINKSFEEFKTNLPEFLDNWDKSMEILKDVKMIGDKGINIDFGINSDGYVVSESGNMDFIIDLKAYEEAGNKFDALSDSSKKAGSSTQKGIIQFGVDFNSTISNINKDVDITFPELNSTNSFSYADLIKYTAQTAIVDDITAPSAPKVNKVLTTSTAVSGKAEKGSTIIVKNGKTVLGKAVTNSKGVFSVKIKPQKAKVTLTVTATDKSGNVSKAAKVSVK